MFTLDIWKLFFQIYIAILNIFWNTLCRQIILHVCDLVFDLKLSLPEPGAADLKFTSWPIPSFPSDNAGEDMIYKLQQEGERNILPILYPSLSQSFSQAAFLLPSKCHPVPIHTSLRFLQKKKKKKFISVNFFHETLTDLTWVAFWASHHCLADTRRIHSLTLPPGCSMEKSCPVQPSSIENSNLVLYHCLPFRPPVH